MLLSSRRRSRPLAPLLLPLLPRGLLWLLLGALRRLLPWVLLLLRLLLLRLLSLLLALLLADRQGLGRRDRRLLRLQRSGASLSSRAPGLLEVGSSLRRPIPVRNGPCPPVSAVGDERFALDMRGGPPQTE